MENYEFERNISVRCKRDNDKMFVESILEDDYHKIVLNITVDLDNQKIINTDMQMDKIPYKKCKEALNIFKKEMDLRIMPGVKRGFRNSFKKSEGCTHITELMFVTFDYVSSKLLKKNVTAKEMAKISQWVSQYLCMNDTCVVYNKDTYENIDLILKGK